MRAILGDFGPPGSARPLGKAKDSRPGKVTWINSHFGLKTNSRKRKNRAWFLMLFPTFGQKEIMNPAPAPPPLIFHFPDRNYFCRLYSDCLNTAIKRKWPSFSCVGCEDFVPVNWDRAEWREDFARCRALLTVITNPMSCRWRRKGNIGFNDEAEVEV